MSGYEEEYWYETVTKIDNVTSNKPFFLLENTQIKISYEEDGSVHIFIYH